MLIARIGSLNPMPPADRPHTLFMSIRRLGLTEKCFSPADEPGDAQLRLSRPPPFICIGFQHYDQHLQEPDSINRGWRCFRCSTLPAATVSRFRPVGSEDFVEATALLSEPQAKLHATRDGSTRRRPRGGRTR
jgi:hypothetical protein